jgi:hypothetical protein
MKSLWIIQRTARTPPHHRSGIQGPLGPAAPARRGSVWRCLAVHAGTFDILIGDLPKSHIVLTGELHGLGLPANRLEASTIFRAEPVATLSYRIDQEGWLTDYNALATIRVPAAALTSIAVRLQHGTIRVIDASADHVVRSGKLQLDLQTRAGSVQRSEAAAAF